MSEVMEPSTFTSNHGLTEFFFSILSRLRQSSVIYIESDINSAVFSRDVPVPVVLFWK